MEEDITSRRRLKKKFLDRWENEGGRLCDELTSTSKSGKPPEGDRNVQEPYPAISTTVNENPSVGESRPGKK